MPECDHPALTIRPMSAADVAAAVAVHLDAFPGFFLSDLGPRFLRELYQGFLRDDGVALVAEDGASDSPIGIIAGTCQPSGFFRRLLRRRWWAFGLASLPLLARRPAAVRRVLRALRYRGEAPLAPHGALLSTVCVSPRAQRGGVGTALVKAFLSEAQARGARYVYLMAEAEDDRANRFYQRLGFAMRGRLVTPEGRPMNRYLLALEEADSPLPTAEEQSLTRHQEEVRWGRHRHAVPRRPGVRTPADGGIG